jgi:hypothetical protein
MESNDNGAIQLRSLRVFVPGLMMFPPLLRGAPLGGIGEDERGLLYCKSFGIVRKKGEKPPERIKDLLRTLPYCTVPVL